jgi:tRNA (cytosine40_48-C5)-methyltransferase
MQLKSFKTPVYIHFGMNPFLERYKQLGEEFDPKAITVKPTLRVNTLKIPDKELMERLNAHLEKIPFLTHGYHFTSPFSVGAMPEHFLGLIYIQEAASQLPAEILGQKPGELVLDMCAAPGSKTTQMAAMMQNKGTLIALDANNPRLPSLKNNLERCGVSNCIVYKKDATYAEDLGMKFDRILLDAPCSGNFAIEKDWFEKRDLPGIDELAKAQQKMLESAVAVLKKGGTLVYSTCSLEPEENELNINWLLGKYDGVFLEKIDSIGDPGLTEVFGKRLRKEISCCKRLWPHKTGTQGFFVAKLKKA